MVESRTPNRKVAGSSLGPAGIVGGGGSECTALSPPSIPWRGALEQGTEPPTAPRALQYEWLPTAPVFTPVCVCVFTVCVCSRCVCVHGVCVCTLDGLNTEHEFRVWVTTLGRMSRHFHVFFVNKILLRDVSMICFWRNIVVSCYSCSSGAAVSIYCTAPQTFTSGRRWKTKQLLVHIDFDSIGNTVDQKLFGFPPSSKQRLCLAEEGNSGLKQLLSKWRYKNKTLAYFNSWVNYYFNVNHTPNTNRKITH